MMMMPKMPKTRDAKDAKDPKLWTNLDAAAKRQGLELKEWQKRQLPSTSHKLSSPHQGDQKWHHARPTDFRDAVKMYAEWHPERKAELPQLPKLTQNADNAENAEKA
jgi:hypothetical protein